MRPRRAKQGPPWPAVKRVRAVGRGRGVPRDLAVVGCAARTLHLSRSQPLTLSLPSPPLQRSLPEPPKSRSRPRSPNSWSRPCAPRQRIASGATADDVVAPRSIDRVIGVGSYDNVVPVCAAERPCIRCPAIRAAKNGVVGDRDVGDSAATSQGSGAVLLTVTLTPTLVVMFPAASRATSVRVCEPLVAVVLFQVTE